MIAMKLRFLRSLLAVAALTIAAGTASALEEKSLLATDGTLYTVRAGTADELGVVSGDLTAEQNVIVLSMGAQDGSKTASIIPGTAGTSVKRNLDLAYDEQSASLVLLWKEEITVLNVLHLSILHGGAWTNRDLLPNLGFAHAFNPQMLLTHFYVHLLDANGNDQWQMKSLLSVVWWEEASLRQARYCPIFLDEDLQQSDITVYDLPTLIGSSGETSYDGVPPGAYFYPALRFEGPGGAVLASFTDLASHQHVVVRVAFPTDLGKPDVGNPTYLRRREPIVGIAWHGPISNFAPTPYGIKVDTFVGPTYNPTLVWQDDGSLLFTRFAGTAWSPAASIPITAAMPYDKAIRLIEDMATKN
jgi:hypothetical protein